MTSSESSPARYRFGPLERRGLIAGWRGGQIAAVASGLAIGVIALRADPSAAGAVMAVVALGVSVGVATWPVAGRTLEEWAPDAVRYGFGNRHRVRIGRRNNFSSMQLIPVELEGTAPGGALRRAEVIADRSTGTYVTSFRAGTQGFVLLGVAEKSQRIDAWAEVLASMAREGSSLHRLQWTCRSLPGTSGAASGADFTRTQDRAESMSPARRSYDVLLDAEGRNCPAHEVVVSLSVRSAKAARGGRFSLGRDDAQCGQVLRYATTVRRRLSEAGVEPGPILTPEETERWIRDAFGSQTGVDSECPPTAQRRARWPWPMAIQEEWARVLLDDTWHATYWISEWPRIEVGPDFLAPLLLPTDVRHSVSLVMEPVAPGQAARRLEQARTADIADSELRRRGGFLATARRRREEELLAQREVELADGHAPYRFSGYVTASASDPDGLDDAREQVEQAAARCGLELRLCFGDQASAFATCLPLCRGLA